MTPLASRLAIVITLAGALASSRGRALEAGQSAAAGAESAGGLVARVGDRVRSYYDRLMTIICTETVTQQELKNNLTPRGKPKEFVYDLIVTRQPAREGDKAFQVKAERTIRMLNGRPVRKKDRPACTDPQPAYDDPLTFLLTENRGDYRFDQYAAAAGASVAVDFAMIAAEPTTVTWEDTCFRANGGRSIGRIWIEQATNDVLRLESRLAEPFQVTPAPGAALFGRRPIVVERSDTIVRFKRVVFENPDETLLLPESIETTTSIAGVPMPRMQTTQTFTSFKRYMTEVKVKGA